MRLRPAHFQLPHRQRTEAVRIPRDDNPVLRQKHQRKRAFQLQQRIPQRARQRLLPRVSNQVQNHFGVAGRLKNRPAVFEFFPKFRRVGDVAVVRHRDPALIAVHGKRLRVARHGVARRGITSVPDRHRSRQPPQHVVRENIGNMAHRLRRMDHFSVAARNARAFLAAVLECV